jgi:hypothetical protein
MRGWEKSVGCPFGVERVILELLRSLPVYLQLRTYRCTALSDAMCQSTKSLCDSPLKRGLPEGAVTK